MLIRLIEDFFTPIVGSSFSDLSQFFPTFENWFFHAVPPWEGATFFIPQLSLVSFTLP